MRQFNRVFLTIFCMLTAFFFALLALVAAIVAFVAGLPAYGAALAFVCIVCVSFLIAFMSTEI